MISLKKFNCLMLQVLSIILENDEIASDANGILINSEITYKIFSTRCNAVYNFKFSFEYTVPTAIEQWYRGRGLMSVPLK